MLYSSGLQSLRFPVLGTVPSLVQCLLLLLGRRGPLLLAPNSRSGVGSIWELNITEVGQGKATAQTHLDCNILGSKLEAERLGWRVWFIYFIWISVWP